jgi:nicotinate-nucleotide adenylyltransferase
MSKHHARMASRLPGPSAGLTIGVMGGTFDPPHAGHAHVIEVARQRLGLDAVWVFPAASNPLKRTHTAFVDRFAAARHRLGGPRTLVTSLESDLGLVYTVDLLRRLKTLAPRANLVWIMGADSLASFDKWRQWRSIAHLVPIAVISRPGATASVGLSRFARMFGDYRLHASDARALARRKAPAWTYITAPFDQTSSTEMRAMMQMNTLMPL